MNTPGNCMFYMLAYLNLIEYYPREVAELFIFCCKAKKTIDEKQLYIVIQSEFEETLKYIKSFENIILKYLLSGEINLTDFIKNQNQ